MLFECLANELILDLFEFLNTFDLLRAFFGLNSRYNQLLWNRFQSYHLDFRSISKPDFETICQQHLPSILARTISLHLCDHEETPNLPKIFLSLHFTIDQFLHLRSLSLSHIQSFDVLDRLLSQCYHLPTLIHLNLIKCYFNYSENEMQSLMNRIWRLPKLTHCILDQITSRKLRLTSIPRISTSIKHLTLEKITSDLKDLVHLFAYTPNLQWLSINLLYGFPNQQLLIPIFSIVSLKSLYHGCIDSLINLFENLPNLINLTLETFDIYCNGDDWAKLLLVHLPNLKRFRLKMNLNFPDYDNIDQQANDLLDTFRSSFWLVEHQWFVRCDWDPRNIFRNGILYTLPYAFDDCFYFDAVSSISTCALETNHWSYDRVQILSHGNPENDLGKDSIIFSARFPKIRHLKLSFPFHESFLPCISSLDYLTSINVTLLYTDSAYLQLQDLFNRASRLYALKLSYSADFPWKFLVMTSPSIRRLNFLKNSPSATRYLNDYECSIIAHSPMILQCEVLSIGIKNRSNIIHLINKMSHLRSFNCHCADDEHYSCHSASSTTREDELIEWLRDRLPLTHVISRDEKRTYLIRIWIGM